jgi:hypothetical protein
MNTATPLGKFAPGNRKYHELLTSLTILKNLVHQKEMKMKKLIVALTAMFLFAAFALPAKITVKAVKGNVAYKKGGGWKKLRKGMNLSEGTSVLSSSGSFALLSLNGHSVTVRPSSRVKVYESGLSKSSSNNHVGVSHGSVKVKVKKMKKVKTSFKVSTPVATSSVRGTEEVVSFGPSQGMKVRVISGVVDIANDKGISSRVSGKQKFAASSGQAKAKSVLSTQQSQSSVNIGSPEVTREEAQNFADGQVETVDSPDFINEIVDPSTDSGGSSSVTINPVWE